MICHISVTLGNHMMKDFEYWRQNEEISSINSKLRHKYPNAIIRFSNGYAIYDMQHVICIWYSVYHLVRPKFQRFFFFRTIQLRNLESRTSMTDKVTLPCMNSIKIYRPYTMDNNISRLLYDTINLEFKLFMVNRSIFTLNKFLRRAYIDVNG